MVKENDNLWNKKLNNSKQNYLNKGVFGTPSVAIFKNVKVVKNILGKSFNEMIEWIKKFIEEVKNEWNYKSS